MIYATTRRGDLMQSRDEYYRTRRSTRWIYSTLPASIAMGPLSGVITLYILQLGGTVIDVSYAIALASALAIPAAIFWGRVSDTFQKRKAQIVVSYAGLAVLLVAFTLISSVSGIILTFGLYSFITAANAAPLNLLVMETSPRQRWQRSFSKLQYMSSLGSTIGLMIAVVIAVVLSLSELMLIFAAMAVASIALTALLVYQPKEMFRRVHFTRNLFAFMSRMFTSPVNVTKPVMILRTPSAHGLMRLRRRLSSPAGGYRTLTIIYYAIFLFSIGSGLFNTAYPAGLKEVGISQSNVFLVLLVGSAVQVIAFYLLGASFGRSRSISTIRNSLVIRAASYMAIGIPFVFYSATGAFLSGLILYPIAAGIAYAFYYATSNTLVFDSLKGPGRGSALGAYTALMGIGTFIGSLISGYTSFYVGYWFTFVAGGILILLSAHVFTRLGRRHAQQQHTSLHSAP